MVEFIHAYDTVIWWLAVASIITFVATLIVVPMLVVRIPSDYFSHREHSKTSSNSDQHPVVQGLLLIGKNALGYVFIMVGIVMLFIPGQGILTIVVGLTLINFPGKYRLGRWLVVRRPILRSINWIRQRSKRNPLILN